MHNWSPLSLSNSSSASKNVLLVDTTQNLTAVSIGAAQANGASTVTAQTGITMENLMAQLETNGYGLAVSPAPGDLTLGGALAIDGHGTSVSTAANTLNPGHSFGTVSNLILSLTAVVWNGSSYVLKTFQRSDPQCQAFLTHLGRAFITEVTLQVGANLCMQCQSIINIPTSVLFGPDGSSQNTFASYVLDSGRAEAIWFPFTDTPWLKVWRVAEQKPLSSRYVNTPYNYAFSDNLPVELSNLASNVLNLDPALAPLFGSLQLTITQAGLASENSSDIWGWSKNVLLYVRPTTLRVTANGYAIVTSRNNIQRVVNEFTTQYKALVSKYQNNWTYPMNGPVEIRVTGLDNPSDVMTDNALSPQLSAARPCVTHPEWDVVVWLDILTIPGTPHAYSFYSDMEQWILSNYTGDYALLRTEWSKGWGFSTTAAWSNANFLKNTLPNAYTVGQNSTDNWSTAIATLNTYDPFRIFSSPLLDSIT